jgi:hypothetical protein
MVDLGKRYERLSFQTSKKRPFVRFPKEKDCGSRRNPMFLLARAI